MGEGAPGGTGLKGSILSPSSIYAERGECAGEVTAQNSGRASAGEAEAAEEGWEHEAASRGTARTSRMETDGDVQGKKRIPRVR